MIKGKTESGFKFEISENVANDYELVEMLGEIEEQPLLFSRVVNKVLGKEQTSKLKEHIRTEDGLIPTDVMMQEVMAIFNSGAQTKNS